MADTFALAGLKWANTGKPGGLTEVERFDVAWLDDAEERK